MLLLKCHLVYWGVWNIMLDRPWRLTGYLPLDWCIFIEILKWTCTKQWRCSYLIRHEGQILDNFKKSLSIKVIKIVLDSMLYETLVKKNKIPDPFPLSSIIACILLSLSYAPVLVNCLWILIGFDITVTFLQYKFKIGLLICT